MGSTEDVAGSEKVRVYAIGITSSHYNSVLLAHVVSQRVYIKEMKLGTEGRVR